ncbi:MAG: PQQ-binding-like beta-propeller repeat protein [Dehalococcoidia bacterium]
MKHPQSRRPWIALTGLITGVALLATACTGDTHPAKGWAPPVPAPGNTLLVQSGAGRLTATKPDGTRVADYQVPGPMTSAFFGLRQVQSSPTPLYATPLVDGSTAYIVSHDGRVVRLSLENSSLAEQWTVDLHQKVVATPILRGDRLYVSTENGHLEVLNTANGTVISSSRPTDGRVWGSPAMLDGRIFIGTLDSSQVLAVNADTGAVEWEQPKVGASASQLVVEGDTLVVASFDRTIHALDTAGGAERWRFVGDGWFVGAPLVTQQAVYAGSMRGSAYALDRQGKMLWRFQREGLEFRSTPVLIGDTLVMLDRNGVAVGLNAADGTEKWTRTAEGTTIDANAAAVDGAVFAVTNDYRLLRVDPATGDIKTFDVQPPRGGGN